MNKKIFSLLLAGALALSLAACAKEDSVTPPGGNTPGNTSAAGSVSGGGEVTLLICFGVAFTIFIANATFS